MIGKDDNFWEATFIPGEQPYLADDLLDRVSMKRQADFVAFCLKLLTDRKQSSVETRFEDKFQEFTSMGSEQRLQVLRFPLFFIWFKRAIQQLSCPNSLRECLEEFDAKGFIAGGIRNGDVTVLVDGRRVKIERFDVSPHLNELTTPEYFVPDRERQERFEANVYYPLSFFAEMVHVALERLRMSWIEAYRDFPKFVRVVVDMIDGPHTSYSASGHPGIIFVSTDNSPLVGLEEFLIHEFGHQILYCVMELDDVVLPGQKDIFKLPWSGNQRGAYGYFHAFYIYTFVISYLQRTNHRSRREQNRIDRRIEHIVQGLRLAAVELDNRCSFTPYGRQLFENLCRRVAV